MEDKSSVTVVVDQNIFNDQTLAFRAFSGSNSITLHSDGLKSFLDVHAEGYQVLDFSNLVAASPAPTSRDKPAKTKKVKETAEKSDGTFD